MTRKFDNFLIGLLWLLSIMLATTFWMNIKYGFNILSAAHWAYLSELQASRTQIKFDFYISLIAALVIGLVGLYILVRPRFRKIPVLQPEMKLAPMEPHTPAVEMSNYESQNQTPPQAPTPQIMPARPIPPSGLTQRKTTAPQTLTPPPAPVTAPVPNVQQISNNNNSGIQKIFESDNYVVKPSKKIGRIIAPVVALGYDNTVWICASGTTVDDMRDAIQTIITVFDDTLGDTANDLSVRGCIVDTTEESDNPELILTFRDMDAF